MPRRETPYTAARFHMHVASLSLSLRDDHDMHCELQNIDTKTRTAAPIQYSTDTRQLLYVALDSPSSTSLSTPVLLQFTAGT